MRGVGDSSLDFKPKGEIGGSWDSRCVRRFKTSIIQRKDRRPHAADRGMGERESHIRQVLTEDLLCDPRWGQVMRARAWSAGGEAS